MFRFNYRTNLLLYENESYCLDTLREWLLINATELCFSSKIRTIFRPGVIIHKTLFVNGITQIEISKAGRFVNTYDWDGIFFNASKQGLIQNFIDENTRNRTRLAEAIAG